jgi:hypothetical protein
MSCFSSWPWASTSAERTAVLAAALLLAAAPAAAEGPATPSPAAVSEENEEGTAELSSANEALYLLDYGRAAKSAWAALTKTKPTSEKHESAQLALAQALEGLGYAQAAAEYYFAVAEERQNPALLSRALAGIESLSRKGAIDRDKLERGVLVEAELSSLPSEIADFLHYRRGLANLRQGYRRWAEKDFAEVRKEGYYGRRVLLARAASAVKEGQAEQAIGIVDEYLRERERREEKAREERGLAPLEATAGPGAPAGVKLAKRGAESEARLIRARLLYELGQYEQAVSEYQRVVRTEQSPAGELLLERAWVHFRGGEYHDAMGLLYALGAPSNRGLFLPDQYVLRGLIYQRFCHFRAAKAAVADYRQRYGQAVSALKNGAAATEVPPIAAAADELVEVVPYVRVHDSVVKERGVLENKRGLLEEGGLADHLAALYATLDERSAWVLDRARNEGARDIAERLLEADEQANLLEYEVGLSIFRPLKEEGGKIAARAPAEQVPPHGVRIYYPFDDEFWSDELPNMRFLIQDRCVER